MGRLHKARTHGVRSDTLVAVLNGNGAGELQNGALGHAVKALEAETLFPADRGGDDDRATAVFKHVRNNFAADDKGRANIDVHEALVIVVGAFHAAA
jgi:hypothetical protein